MFTPEHYRINSDAEIRSTIRDLPFATLISHGADDLLVTHLPLIFHPSNNSILWGHMARQNPHSAVIGDDKTSIAVFSGPHAYISPEYYESRPNVPTWNYVAVHAHGRLVTIADLNHAIGCLSEFVATFDPNLVQTQPQSVDVDYWTRMLGSIVPFEFHIDRLEGKAKLSQNKSIADRVRVISALEDSQRPGDRDVAAWMKRQIESS